jgi:hypothetical protein
MTSSGIPYATEQGIFCAYQGIFFKRTGISGPEQGISTEDEYFGRGAEEAAVLLGSHAIRYMIT